MSKITHTAAAFARRVQMGNAKLWILVEGKSNDAAFYDRLAETLLPASDYSVRAVEEITLDEKQAGGKKQSLKLLDYWDKNNELKQVAKSGQKAIILAVDRDFDDFERSRLPHAHLLYTRAADVEGEVLMNSDLRDVAAASYSIPRTELPPEVHHNGFNTFEALGTLWFDWIALRVCACRSNSLPGVRHGGKSEVNTDTFGPVDKTKLSSFHSALIASSDISEEQRLAIVDEVAVIRERGKLPLLVKGKWIETYVWKIVQSVTFPHPASIKADVLTRTAIAKLNYQGSWAAYYRNAFNTVLATEAVAA